MTITEDALRKKYSDLEHCFDEKAWRLSAAADARVYGRGGVSIVARATGLSRTTIYAGLKELKEKPDSSGVRKKGGGRKNLKEINPQLLKDLNKLICPVTRGDPENPLRWTSKSTVSLAEELRKTGHSVSQRSVWNLLKELGYSMQSNRKANEGASHPDRDAQFQFISDEVDSAIDRGQPAISIDTKKKELVGNFKNGGAEWEKKGEPQRVNTYDFMDKNLGKVAPYGIYDIAENKGWVNVGISSDTAEFAVESIRRWWNDMGKLMYPNASELVVTADGGGSNGSRVRLWKIKLQELSSELGITIKVRHFPPGTSKWNKIEHRMFCHITQNWRGRPLLTREIVVKLIGSTRTKEGLEVRSVLDENVYETGVKVTDGQMKEIRLKRNEFHGEWNYEISPEPVPDCSVN